MAYTFTSYTASNGVVLHTIKTSPSNIVIRHVGATTVPGSGFFGINGGFFNMSTGDLLQIAVNNDVPIKGSKSAYGSGYTNYGDKARGTLVWDLSENEFSVQVVKSAADLAVVKRTAFWAQGGISMNLNSDSTWASKADNENMPNRTGSVERSGLVYNNTKNIWLVVTPTKCSAEAFRKAIKDNVGSGTLVNGIFLDGSGSSQIKCTEKSYSGDTRSIHQMVALRYDS
ncbi:hypothetical protein SAMN05428961_11316 [Paenibacillus sp. OK060]|uniref:hypothetical protein n=1 Tax=Paenibacillus sp. OK060 TaxID=1881034 RepID=UPI0008875928|nr:hypothetical protein [Paenibacillus sp. OK060]SDM29742.1 hypothetical protein SAMN05428961_11316 [Paenibacillus sp. OK060]